MESQESLDQLRERYRGERRKITGNCVKFLGSFLKYADAAVFVFGGIMTAAEAISGSGKTALELLRPDIASLVITFAGAAIEQAGATIEESGYKIVKNVNDGSYEGLVGDTDL